MSKTNQKGVSYWRALGDACGLEESVGKTYFSNKFLNINSTTYEYHEGRTLEIEGKTRQIPYKLVQYVNLSLLLGIKRSQGGDKRTDTNFSASTRAREIVKLTPDRLLKRVTKLFLSKLGKERLPWFIPEWLGGLGLPREMGEPTELDLRMAHLILINWKDKKPARITNPAQWQTRKIAEKSIPLPQELPLSRASMVYQAEYEALLSLKGVALLFDARVNLKDLIMETPEGDEIKRKIRKNESLWQPPKGKLPSPLTIAELAYRKRVEGYPVNWISNYSHSTGLVPEPIDNSFSHTHKEVVLFLD